MVPTGTPATHDALARALSLDSSSARLRAALSAGTRPDPGQVAVLIARCAVEPDFFVRDMLTWALTRHDRTDTVDALVSALDSPAAQARSQALHTLAKIGDRRGWEAMTPALLRDEDDEVARAAWRTATALVPPDRRRWLAGRLATQLGRGDREMHRSLSRAFVALGDEAADAIARARDDRDPAVRAHAGATARLLADPDADITGSLEWARREAALAGLPHDDRGRSPC